jgi:acyl-coenzyme A synthetase/AMP-(fatty) acid ligase
MSSLFSHIQEFEDTLAIVDELGHKHSYKQLCVEAKKCCDEIAKGSQLVFIKAQNNYSTVVAYVACMLAGHPVLLVAADNTVQLDELINRYQPNFIVDTSGTAPHFAACNAGVVKLHEDLCLLLSTSGSTGSPKLVKLSNDNVATNCDAIINYLRLTHADRAITSLPLHYSYGLSILNIHLRAGASIVLTELSVTDDGFWASYKKHQVSSFSGVPYSFQALLSVGFDFASAPSTRYVTQAGGKLSKESILHFANQLKLTHKQFFVMYGQTEAAPRISYLPPERVFEHAECIGIAIDGGSLTIEDDNKLPISQHDMPGELVYQGPNIMMGYALNQNDFYSKDQINTLYTGDIAIKKANGLFQIVGRASRFVKPFGIRVNLDDIQNQLSRENFIVAVTGTDEKILVVIQSTDKTVTKPISALISSNYSLPFDTFQIEVRDVIPRLSNDKFDYKQLEATYFADSKPKTNIGLFFHEFKKEVLTLLGLSGQSWDSVTEIYSSILDTQEVEDTSSFRSLSGDSLSYVAVSCALEEYLGSLPINWHNMSIRALQKSRQSNEL